MFKFLRTSDLARAAGVHVNTVRLYEQWGLIPAAERSPAGYRRFTAYHRDCLLLARLVYAGGYPGKAVRKAGVTVVLKAAGRDLGGALEAAYQHQAAVHAERAQAEAAASLLERWAQGQPAEPSARSLRIGDAARLLGVTIDMLRNWERNGLLAVPRRPENGYRLYGPEEIGRARVIRMLGRAGYSTLSILRMLTRFDEGQTEDLRAALDVSEEDLLSASDRWLSTLAEREERAAEMITLLERMIREQAAEMA